MGPDDTLPMATPLDGSWLDTVPAGGCRHVFAESRGACPHPVTPEADLCLWHNPAVVKDDAYVACLVQAAVEAARGDLVEANLVGLIAPGLSLPGVNLHRADLRDADLDGADLSKAVLSGAVLRRASLRRAKLGGADLSGADLADANLTGADLRSADLRGARLDGTVLNGADLGEADLTGAQVVSFRWNARTRLAGARGLPAGIDPASVPADGILAAPEAANDTTREFRSAGDHPSALRPAAVAASDLRAPDGPNPAPVPAPSRRGPWLGVAIAAAVVAIAGTALGVWGLRAAAAIPTDSARLVAERDTALHQAEANLAEIRRLQATAAELEQAATAAKTEAQRSADEVGVRRAEADDARKRLTAAETDLVRLRDADDRSALMALRLDAAMKLSREQAIESAKQERIGGILAEGVSQLRDENTRLAKSLDARVAEEHRADALAAEAARLGKENEALKADRDAIAARERRLNADLDESRRAIAGYLSRVAEANLGSVLGDEASQVPLVPVKAGSPIALSGDYLVSLQLDQIAGGVAAKLVVQRPAGAANPDVSVILYDRDQRPLRRLGFGFPHVDAGAPFASASATVVSERFPSFARVIVSPAATAPVGAR